MSGGNGHDPDVQHVPPQVSLVGTTSSRAVMDRWALALLALHTPHQIIPLPDGALGLVVRPEDAVRAGTTLRELEQEEHARAVEVAQTPPVEHIPGWAMWFSQALCAVLLAFGMLAGGRGDHTLWMAQGRMDAGLVLHGAWHRMVTGVTLHADGGHLLGNMAFLMVLAPVVVQRLGPGVTAAALLWCGAVGNAVTVGVHGPNFGNVGASGGVFGILCLLGLVSARTRQSRLGQNRWLMGVGTALAMLMMMGFGEESDIVAHLGGFAAAVPLGLLFPIKPNGKAPLGWKVLQVVTGLGAAATLAAAWWVAMHTPL